MASSLFPAADRRKLNDSDSRRRLRSVQGKRKSVLVWFLVFVIVLMFVTHSTARSGAPFHEYLEWLGIALVGFCILGRMWCSIYISGNKREVIVDKGPYSVTRNPLYLFSAAGAAGVGLTSGSIVVGLLFAVITLAVFHVVVRSEESFLRTEFPETYEAYAARVPRWLPRMANWQDADWVRTRPANIVTTFRDSCWFLLAFPVFELIEYLQDIGFVSVLIVLP